MVLTHICGCLLIRLVGVVTQTCGFFDSDSVDSVDVLTLSCFNIFFVL